MNSKHLMYLLMLVGALALLAIGPGLYFATIKDSKGIYFIGYGLSIYGICCGIAQLWATKHSSIYKGWRLNLIKLFYKCDIVIGSSSLFFLLFF